MARGLAIFGGQRIVRALVLTVVVAGLVAAPAAAQGPWPSDGQNAFNQRNSSDGPGKSPSGVLASQAWKRTFDSAVTGTPIIAANKGLYVGTHSGEVYGIVAKTGQTYWAAGSTNVGGPIIGSVLYANNSVYAAASRTGSPRVVALDPMTGDRRWSTIVDNQADADVWGSPAYSPAQNLVYVGICGCSAERANRSSVRTRGGVVALDATTGAVVWKTYTVAANRTGGSVSGTPLVYDFGGRMYVTTGHSYLSDVDPNTGAVLALDPATGAILDSFQANADDFGTSTPVPTSKQGFAAGPLGFLNDKQGLLGAGAKNGIFYALDPLTLDKVWEARVGAGTQYGGIVGASAFDGKALYGTSSNTPPAFWSLSPAGSHRWLFPGNDANHHGPVSTARGRVWSTDTSGFLDVQNSSNGALIARIPLGAPSVGGVSFGFRYAYAAIGHHGLPGGGVVAYR